MRLNYLDILEQCFHDKLRGYNKEEVDTFLHLVADDFKEMAEEIQQLKKKINKKDLTIEELKKSLQEGQNKNPAQRAVIPEFIKEKAKRILKIAQDQADEHKQKTVGELSLVKREIQKLKQEKTNLIETIKAAAQAHIDQMRKQR